MLPFLFSAVIQYLCSVSLFHLYFDINHGLQDKPLRGQDGTRILDLAAAPPDVESQTSGSQFSCPPTWLACNQCQLLLQVRVRSGTHTVPSSGPGFATYYLHDFMEVAPSFEPYFCQLKIEIR